MRGKLVIFLMSGSRTPELAEAAVQGGADLIELGFPFSDPLADGPGIRHAAENALAEGMRTKACLRCLAEIRARVQVPLVPFVYSALLEAYGHERFVADAHAAGGGAILVPDLPVDSLPELRRIQLVAPTSTDERIKLAADSPSIQMFDLWYAAQQTTRDAYVASGTIKIPSVGREYVCINGALTGYTPLPAAKKVLQDQEYEITFESVTKAGV